MDHPVLKTERLELRPIRTDDLPSVFEMQKDEINRRFLDNPIAKDPAESQTFIQKILKGYKDGKWYYWAMSSYGKFVGTICLWQFSKDKKAAELGYELSRNYQGKGYMTEALKRVINFAFETNKMESLVAYTHHMNTRSVELLKKMNFKFVRLESATADESAKLVFSLKKHSHED